MLEVANDSAVADFPNQQAVLLYLFDGWFCHRSVQAGRHRSDLPDF